MGKLASLGGLSTFGLKTPYLLIFVCCELGISVHLRLGLDGLACINLTVI
jgi:hypothetical protein